MTAWRQAVPRPLRLAASGWLARRASARLQRELSAMAARPGLIVAGPWLGEVGFELLYWVPFLRWFAERFGVDRDRILVVSRGGTASWYQSVAAHYRDVFDDLTPEAFRQQHDERVRTVGEQKQRQISAFDREVAEAAARKLSDRTWTLLHPSQMYELFNPYWWGHLSRDWVHDHARYTRLPELPRPAVAGTSAPYVAVKFYFNDCFPATDANRGLARELLKTLTTRGPVVALSTGLNIDDHGGVHVDDLGIRYLPAGVDPAHNLEVQSAIVAAASAFVGTYGGFSYLPPLYGVKSVAFFTEPDGFSRKHLEMARSAFAQIGSDGLLDVRDMKAAHAVDDIGAVTR